MALVAYTYLSYGAQIDFGYLIFVGASTVLTYSLHRLVGIRRMGRFNKEGRFATIKKYRSHIAIYALCSAVLCFIVFWAFTANVKLYLGAAAVVSFSYTLPVFGAERRLRDFAFIKIFAIAAVWSFVTESLVLISTTELYVSTSSLLLAFAERFLFFLAITLPFDIRDLEVDRSSNVKTIPSVLGTSFSLTISHVSLLIAALVSLLSRPLDQAIPLLLCYFGASFAVFVSTRRRSDYWYSGLLDGTMMIPILMYVLTQIL